MNNLESLLQMISNNGKADPRNMINMMLQNNPQLNNILNTSPEDAKNKIQQMAKSGFFTQAQLKQFEDFAQKAGIKSEALEELDKEISFKPNKNRW